MDLTNIEGIERLECITVFTVVASKLSSNLHLFCTQLCKGKKKIGNVTVKTQKMSKSPMRADYQLDALTTELWRFVVSKAA